MKAAILSLLLLMLASHPSPAQVKPVQFGDLAALQEKDPRPVVILLMTSWCKYCHAMKNTMLRNRQVSKLLTDKYYVVFFDAEDRKEIRFAGKIFRYRPTGTNTGVHELAFELGTINGQVAYPSLCILSPDNRIIFQHSGFLGPRGLLTVMSY